MRLGWATRAILCVGTVFSVLNEVYFYASGVQSPEGDESAKIAFGMRMCPYLAIVLGRTPWWAPYTLFSAPFVQHGVVPSLLFALAALTGGNYCERCWSTPVYLRFVLFALTVPLLVEACLCAIVFPRSGAVLFGGSGLLAGVVVALRQLIPGHTIILLRNRMRLPIQHLPIFAMVLFGVLDVLGFESNPGAFYLGLCLCWFYLRFVHRGERGERGDPSDAFAFVRLFPKQLAPVLEPVLNRIYRLALKLKLLQPFSEDEVQTANERYQARLSGRLLPVHARGGRATSQRRKMMLRAMGQ